jgi:hypothetical protein
MSNWRTLSRSLGAVRGSHAKGGRASLRFGGGRTDLLEELGRVEGERSNRNRRAEISRVHSELNRGYAKGGRAAKFGGGRTDLLEELGRVEGERSNRNRRAEISRVHSELNKGYKDGGRIGFKKGTDKKWIQKATASIKKRGTKGKCTPITKPGCTGRAKALAKTFKKMAAKRKKA